MKPVVERSLSLGGWVYSVARIELRVGMKVIHTSGFLYQKHFGALLMKHVRNRLPLRICSRRHADQHARGVLLSAEECKVHTTLMPTA